MHGRVLLIDKAMGMGSTDVVRTLRRRLGTARIGHAGTLDPDATGLLIVCVDEATKLVPWMTAEDKTYDTVGRLGASTTSDDAAGKVLETAPFDHVTRDQLESALEQFRGEHDQLPPAVSAIKVDGRRLYDRVHAGEDVDELRTPRRVRLDDVRLVGFESPDFHLEMAVGKGFYVRSIIRDIGVAVNSLAHVTQLRRTRIGPFLVSEAIALDDVDASSGLEPEVALARVLPVLEADPRLARRVGFGQRVPVDELPSPPPAGPFVVSFEGRHLAVVSVIDEHLTVIRGL